MSWILIGAALAQDADAPGDTPDQVQETSETTPATPAVEPAPKRFTSTGHVRLLGSHVPDFAVNADGGTVGQGMVLESRARLGFGLSFGRGAGFLLEGDVLDAQLVGSPWQLGGMDTRRRDLVGVDALKDVSTYVPRQAMVYGPLGPVMVSAGLQTSQWGLGLLSNDGTQDPLFGRSDGGDVVLRVKAVTQPLGANTPLVLVVAGDRVYADEIGRWQDDQAAYQGVVAVAWRGDVELGLYGVYRHQRESNRLLRTNAYVIDGTGRIPLVTGESMGLALAFEGVAQLGSTSRASSYNATHGLKIRQGAAVGQLELTSPRVQGWLRGGWASGDGDPYDDRTSNFSADPNFGVGMVLYDEVLGSLDAAAYQQLADPSNIGQPPDGADVLVSEGAWRASTYVNPVVQVDVTEWLHPRVGVLAAWATAPVSQAFTSGRAGGTPTSHLGEPWSGSYFLGTEFDWALEASTEFKGMQPSLTLQGGYLLPGAGLGMDESVVMLHTVTGAVRW